MEQDSLRSSRGDSSYGDNGTWKASREAGINKSDKARIARAMRMLRKGAVSRATKAMESEGMGDLSDPPELIMQMHVKHPVEVRQIGPGIYTFIREEEVLLEVDKILGKLNNEATPLPAKLGSTHLRM